MTVTKSDRSDLAGMQRNLIRLKDYTGHILDACCFSNFVLILSKECCMHRIKEKGCTGGGVGLRQIYGTELLFSAALNC